MHQRYMTTPMLTLHVPQVYSKELRLQHNAATDQRWLRISSNWLDAFGFSPNAPIARTVLAPGQGLAITADPAGTTRVYRRRYTTRRSNPFETQLDLKGQQLLDAAFPGYIERVHVTFTPGRLSIVPVAERSAAIRTRQRRTPVPLTAFVAMSSGIDAACLAQLGFVTDHLLEYRPPEKRDRSEEKVRDLTETGVMTACHNTSFRHVWNEDLRRVSMDRIAAALNAGPGCGLLHLSLQCDDFSALKPKSLKARHLEDGDTTHDLVYDALRLIEAVAPASIIVENVPGFSSAEEGRLLLTKLRRFGYHVSTMIGDAREFGGATSRKRFYVVASVFPGFRMPTPPMAQRPAGWVWNELVADLLHECRDVTDNVSVRLGFETGRIRLLTPESSSAPTVTKSQSRMTKDALYLRDVDGRVRFPSERVLQRLNGIPASFSFAATSSELAQEQIGQSIDWDLHEAIAKAVRNHLLTNW